MADLFEKLSDKFCNCSRCGAICKVSATVKSDAKMLRRAVVPKGYCVNCSVTDFLAHVYPANMIIEQSSHGAAILLFPPIQQQFIEIMKAHRADASPDEINWELIVKNWDLPLKVSMTNTNPHLPGDAMRRRLAEKEIETKGFSAFRETDDAETKTQPVQELGGETGWLF